MLGRLRIQLPDCIPMFAELVSDVFSEKKLISTNEAASFKATKLEAALKKSVRDATGDENALLMDTLPDSEDCKTYVLCILLSYAYILDH
jgi:hypothetical protein